MPPFCDAASEPHPVPNELRNPESFEAAVTPHLPRLVQRARSILGSEDLAWDAVQETLQRLWVQGWLPDDPAGPLMHLVVRSSLHLLRCDRRRAVHEDVAASFHENCCEDDPLAQLEGEEERACLRKAVQGIAQEYRSALELFAFEGHSYAAIAERLSLPIGTVRSRISRGKELLRRRLESPAA